MSSNRVLRIAGLVLVLAVLPLTVFAAVSMGTRVAQHGLSPERLWGLVAIAVAVAYGLAWLVAVVRGWKAGEWRERVRRANLHLAVVICGVALFLALPILDFGAISARQQIARLETGRVAADEFDYEALRWDFGKAGRRALARLEASGNPVVAELATKARRIKVRTPNFGPSGGYVLRMRKGDAYLEQDLRDYIRVNPWACVGNCFAIDVGNTSDGRRRVAIVTGSGFLETVLPMKPSTTQTQPVPPARPLLQVNSTVEIQTIARRYIVVDGRPLGQALDDTPLPLEPPPPRR